MSTLEAVAVLYTIIALLFAGYALAVLSNHAPRPRRTAVEEGAVHLMAVLIGAFWPAVLVAVVWLGRDD